MCPASSDPLTIGLALGGGGARGLAHISVLEVFDELGLRPARMAGTSIGALLGAAYASGMSAAEIRERTSETLSNPAAFARKVFSGSAREWMDLVSLRPLAAALMNPERLVSLLLPVAEGATIETLDIPFAATATDYREQRPVVFDEGPLTRAVAASIALPGLFKPVLHQGHVLADGGLTNPLPYDLLGGRVSVSVAIDVTGHLRLDRGRTPTALEALLASAQIMQNAIVREKLKNARPDILIRPPVNEFRILEFYKAENILAAAAPVKEELKRALAGYLEKAV